MEKLINITGKALSGEWGIDDKEGIGIPVLRTTNFTNDGIVDYSNVITRTIAKKNIADKFLRKGDIIIEKSGGSDNQPVGRVVYFDNDENKYLFNNFTGLLRVKDTTKWLPKYIFYSLFANYQSGGTRRYENKTTGLHNLQTDFYVKDFEIKETSYSEQIEICELFDKITDLIDKRKQQLEKLDELVKARFVEMFGDCVHNDRGWRAKTVERVCKGIYGGGTPSKAHSEYYENGNIPWVSSKDMKTDILTDSQVHINQLGIDNSTAQLVPVNSVIMVIRSGILKHTLPVAINAVPITVNQDLKVFIPKNEILARFLAVQFKMHEKDILAGVRAVTADNIEFNSLKQRELIVPPIEFQQKYVSFLEQIDKSKFEIKQSLEKLELLKKALMQKYFG